MGRTENVAVFQDTQRMYRTNEKLKESLANSIANEKLILESDKVENIEKNIYEEPAEIVVSKKKSFEAAERYKGLKTCVHNFASASNPGGGVVNGATAQEECLCRISTLYDCLNTDYMWKNFYNPHRAAHDPIHNDDIIYTPGVTVFKTDTDTPRLMDEENWYQVDVVTCAAPNLRVKPSNSYNSGDGDKAVKVSDSELQVIHEKRLRRILDVAVMNGDEVVILGAFGCGAFANDPYVAARAAKNVIAEYKNAFKVIEFAVYCGPRDDKNYRVFEATMKGR